VPDVNGAPAVGNVAGFRSTRRGSGDVLDDSDSDNKLGMDMRLHLQRERGGNCGHCLSIGL
jgi:hypothetical protein